MATLTDLIVWQLAEQLNAEVVKLSNQPAARREFKFRDQILPAASSVAANIAEGYGRRSHGDFARFIGIAQGSLRETETWIRDGAVRQFWTTNEAAPALLLCKRLTVGLTRLRAHLRSTPTPK
jgi:four helix bundle protein